MSTSVSASKSNHIHILQLSLNLQITCIKPFGLQHSKSAITSFAPFAYKWASTMISSKPGSGSKCCCKKNHQVGKWKGEYGRTQTQTQMCTQTWIILKCNFTFKYYTASPTSLHYHIFPYQMQQRLQYIWGIVILQTKFIRACGSLFCASLPGMKIKVIKELISLDKTSKTSSQTTILKSFPQGLDCLAIYARIVKVQYICQSGLFL